MNKNLVIITLVLVVVVLLGVGGYLYFSQSKGSPAVAVCTPATGEAAFSGKVAYLDQYKQYTLQSTNGTTYYLRATDDQKSRLQVNLGKNAQVNGTLVTPESSDVNVTTVCP